jgi:hypothetical protein
MIFVFSGLSVDPETSAHGYLRSTLFAYWNCIVGLHQGVELDTDTVQAQIRQRGYQLWRQPPRDDFGYSGLAASRA